MVKRNARKYSLIYIMMNLLIRLLKIIEDVDYEFSVLEKNTMYLFDLLESSDVTK